MSQTQSQAAALRLAVLLAGAGVLHFATPKFFDVQVPSALPGNARTYTQISGVAELAVATALAVPRTRRLGGTAAAALFVAVFPANINLAWKYVTNSATSPALKAAMIARLPLQIPLVTESLKARRHAA